MNISKYLSEAASTSLRDHISEADGNEVFLVGYLNDKRIVETVEVFARGNETATPALMQAARPGNVVIHNHPSGVLRPSGADLQVASALGNDGIGFYIVNNQATDIFVVVEPFQPKEAVPIDAGSLTGLFDQDGPLAKALANFEFRPPQIEMIEAITRAINEDKVAVIEAGTGTGKTFAYLLPAISHALENKERVVVSTNTINLQEQLIHKDLPLLRQVVEKPFKAVLVKGRSNYACKRKLAEADKELDLFSEQGEKAELKAIVDWARSSKDGSKSDLNIEPRPEVWEKIQSESDTTLRTKCPYYNECFFYTARRQAATADILVANHHLLFSDLAVRAVRGASENAVLPSYSRIIFDEAHNIEDVATSYFGLSTTYLGVRRILNKLFRRKKEEERGLLPYLIYQLQKLGRHTRLQQLGDAIHFLQSRALPAVEGLNARLTQVMEQIYDAVHLRSDAEYGEIKLRLTPQIDRTQMWINLKSQVEDLVKSIHGFTALLTNFLFRLDGLRHEIGWFPASSLTIDAQAQVDRLAKAASAIEQIMIERDAANVRWIEVRQGYKSAKIVRFRSAPLEVAPIMKAAVLKPFKNVILTSATLTVENRFEYLKHRLGLDLIEPQQLLTNALPAPFDYEKQALVGVPHDIPDPKDRSYNSELPALILEAVRISEGRTFVLFTAYGLLGMMYNRLKSEIEALGYNAYRQGQENRHRLLERFKQDASSVLFATDSFWEGVDVPGEALQSIIIVKLPFKVPSEPVVQARIEAIERSGGNAFLQYTVPQAVIKFRQGFGRLIRHRQDRGTVLILDKRIVQKNYGRVFLNSLPDCNVVVGRKAEVFQAMEAFFSYRRAAEASHQV